MKEIVQFVINGMIMCFNTMKLFVLDRVGSLNISLYSFFIFVIFISVTLRIISFIKGIQEIQTEQQEETNSKKPRRYKK